MAQDDAKPSRPRAAIRQRLIEAALRLYEQHGFDQVRVQEIADAAGVTRRTFHRHFPSKGAVVFAHEEELAQKLMAALEQRPATESVLTATRAALGELLLGRSTLALTAVELDTARRVRHLLVTNPELRRANFTGALARRRAVADYYAARTGLPATDLRPQLTALTLTEGIALALDRWATGTNPGLQALYDDIDAVITALQNGVDLDAAPPDSHR
ncbi:TetR family transcriptional regulator [Nocardia brasiliensis]|uniref:TetR family transcriptional regulator n=1 Tax=Nocardia brasiliensis TaxID=37326 RepID=UPI0018930205|nr:TetR family transcriptional regulator [Nocardia brasiliensis]MBF6125587.1 TetR family transcriptional regulator [Nocardia brasiliensis]